MNESSDRLDEVLRTWARAVSMRDNESFDHTLRVTEVTVSLARRFGFEGQKLRNIRRGALLHDIGKAGVPDGILRKTGQLDDDEWSLMKKHPVYARQLMSQAEVLKPAIDIPYCHHEKVDGSGYPEGLSGDEIPLPARLFAVVDVWDALLSDRPYRDPWPREQVLTYLDGKKGDHFEPEIVSEFLDLEQERGFENLRAIP